MEIPNNGDVRSMAGTRPIKDLIKAFNEKKFSNTFENDDYFNIKKMQKINLI